MKMVLLVKDDDVMSMLLADILLSEGYAVMMAKNGLDGLTAARRLHPALVLSDTTLPGLGGVGLARRIRTDPALSTVRIVLMRARQHTPIDPGLCDATIAMPMSISTFVRTVAGALERVAR